MTLPTPNSLDTPDVSDSQTAQPSDAPLSNHPSHPMAGSHIRSFIHRRSHITLGQQEALDKLLSKWALPYENRLIDPAAVFGREAPLVLEIGFGMGETTEKIAIARSEENFLGVEVFNAGVGAMLKRIETSSLPNVRIIQHDAVEVVRDMIAPNSLAGVHVYFPDPWQKKRHHKRRLIQPAFVALLASRIAPGGYLHCATDWEDYGVQMLEVLSGEPSLENTADGYAPRPEWRPQTKFETRGMRLGHGVWDLFFKRRAV
ncbi:tRNA (guanosine(46)-N7)-methyltransferase TrmB [Pigmentiphaga aceris]|uniref:tRNA (guanine-N(7)-)-methyltransferase n=1 Tax=Pigmentiphaga aceris TaxID=1940612 RepID=A0A5C0B5W2_9BURK|nr:tRNA (guanosine(46)-N7)-methyltransferase TrmB [Pigmentiphaga aceris]QEI08251.1 tRNA (guanosine(46)-N7)-methyltransferase TrmB [Pigmentiphaga aceris]